MKMFICLSNVAILLAIFSQIISQTDGTKSTKPAKQNGISQHPKGGIETPVNKKRKLNEPKASSASAAAPHSHPAGIGAEERVFANARLRMNKMKVVGFDMDYTLAEYYSPEVESLTCGLALKKLVEAGYPAELGNLKYDHSFGVRGLWLDKRFGNLLKVDPFGHIMMASHGSKFLSKAEIESYYPNRFVHLGGEEGRIYVLNTMYCVLDTFLIASLVDHFDGNPQKYKKSEDREGVFDNGKLRTYKQMFMDIRANVDKVHRAGDKLKTELTQNSKKYVVKDGRIGKLLSELRKSGRKIFLATNSDYTYTKAIMNYLLGPEWRANFDFVFVSTKKPIWFAKGTPFKVVDLESGKPIESEQPVTAFEGQNVYSGGSFNEFERITKVQARNVLYVGDHIFGDVLRAKKSRGLKTFLIVPELNRELGVWNGQRQKFDNLMALERQLAELQKNGMGGKKQKGEAKLLAQIVKISNEMNGQHVSKFGGLYRHGSHTTFYAGQTQRYADIYAASCFNLIHYLPNYHFRPIEALMPHEMVGETTDDEEDSGIEGDEGDEDKKMENDMEMGMEEAENEKEGMDEGREMKRQKVDEDSSLSEENVVVE